MGAKRYWPTILAYDPELVVEAVHQTRRQQCHFYFTIEVCAALF